MRPRRSAKTTDQRAGEVGILRRLEAAARRGASNGSLLLGLGDDAALWRPSPGHQTILTCDWFLEGTHFLRDKHPPDCVGWKCLARALSDVAAMGGIPRCFLLSLALPMSHTGGWLNHFLGGLSRASCRFGCPLAGGDTTRRQQILISVTAVGEVRSGQALLRRGARPGHVLFSSGRLGEAELGLQLVRQCRGRMRSSNALLRQHLYPEPRLALGQWLAQKRIASAMMDLSDGLSTDLARLCAESCVGARIFSDRLPAVRIPARLNFAREDALAFALHGGDDYELLFAVPPDKVRLVPTSLRGVPLTRIGEITGRKAVVLRDAAGHERPLPAHGWDPFRDNGRA